MSIWHISFVALPVLFAGAIYGEILKRRIPNLLTLSTMAFAVLAALIEGGGAGAKESVLGLLVGGGAFLPFCLLGLVGGGDMKLMAATGAIVGYPLVLRTLTDTCVAGGLLAIGIAAWNGTLLTALASTFRIVFGLKRKNGAASDARRPAMIPYGVAIALGTIASVLLDA